MKFLKKLLNFGKKRVIFIESSQTNETLTSLEKELRKLNIKNVVILPSIDSHHLRITEKWL